ncbi:MAG: hypothetical protein ABT01_08030 [Clostridium sp. SCN 57-10]|nr:MAG: hypothetical protein ABT01_08030 [Clostridium sp. SCN 57-10]
MEYLLMEVFLKIEVNVMSAMLLGVTMLVARHRLQRWSYIKWMYHCAGLTVLLMLLLETSLLLFAKEPHASKQLALTLAYVPLFAAPPVLSCCWFLFCDAICFEKHAAEIKPAHWIPAALNGAVAALSPLGGCLFSVENGVWRKGPLFSLYVATTAGYLLAGAFRLLRQRDMLPKGGFGMLMAVPLLPLAGMAARSIFGRPSIWATAACALIILNAYLQEQILRTDTLTGAWTKGPFEHRLSRLLQSNRGEPFGMIYMDIDNFKTINDQFGHREGDEALQALTATLKRTMRKTDVVARLGGDEFGILARVDGQEGLDAVARKIEQAIEMYNRTSDKPYQITCSLGAKLFWTTPDCSAESILDQADSLMYLHKKSKQPKYACASAE